jgi:Flp pilus assembly protein TadD
MSAGLKKLAAKDLAGAIASFREAVRLNPEHVQAQYQLGLALQKTGAVAEARKHLAEARRLAPYLAPPDLRN